jgi:hypothetical protein
MAGGMVSHMAVGTREVEFHVLTERVRGELNVAGADGPGPAVVLNPDLDGKALAEAAARCRAAGLAIFSYPAPGTPRAWRPHAGVLALRAAVARIRDEPEVDEHRVGVLGVGPLAGGVALMSAADDPWVRAVCARDAVLDGPAWARQHVACSGGGRALDLTSYNHLMRFRPGEALARIPSDRRRAVTSAAAAGPAGDELADDATWLFENLVHTTFEVSVEI